MPAPLTPVPATQSFSLTTAQDIVTNRTNMMLAVTTTASVTGLNATGAAMFGTPVISTTKYTVGSVTSSVFQVTSVSASSQYTVTKIWSSAPIMMVTSTEYFQIVPSNTTVFNSQNSPSSLLLSVNAADERGFTIALAVNSEA